MPIPTNTQKYNIYMQIERLSVTNLSLKINYVSTERSRCHQGEAPFAMMMTGAFNQNVDKVIFRTQVGNR